MKVFSTSTNWLTVLYVLFLNDLLFIGSGILQGCNIESKFVFKVVNNGIHS